MPPASTLAQTKHKAMSVVRQEKIKHTKQANTISYHSSDMRQAIIHVIKQASAMPGEKKKPRKLTHPTKLTSASKIVGRSQKKRQGWFALQEQTNSWTDTYAGLEKCNCLGKDWCYKWGDKKKMLLSDGARCHSLETPWTHSQARAVSTNTRPRWSMWRHWVVSVRCQSFQAAAACKGARRTEKCHLGVPYLYNYNPSFFVRQPQTTGNEADICHTRSKVDSKK